MQLLSQHVEKLGVYIFNEEMIYSNKKYDLEVSFFKIILYFFMFKKNISLFKNEIFENCI